MSVSTLDHRHQAVIEWQRGEQVFTDGRYSRRHRWQFDGGLKLDASSSPWVVPLPFSDASAVDPEEAVVAATASCHMLFFLSFAATEKWQIDSYLDQAEGQMGQDERGKVALLKITLRPQIKFSGASPNAAQLQQLHDKAHAACFIANSLRAEIVIESTQ